MNELEIFKNEKFGEIRTVTIDNEPWFVGKDIALALGYGKGKSLNNAVANHVDEDDKGVTEIMTPGGEQKMIIINESGLYSLILSSKLPNTKKFKHWITSEVLPSIRKHGAYMDDEVIERTLTDPDYLIRLATALKEERQARKAAEQTLEQQKPLVEFANQVSDTKDLIDMKTMAKLLKYKDIDIGRNRLFDFLRHRKILMNDNQPYQEYVDAGYFKVNEYTYTNTFGQTKTNRQTLITGKGQLYIAKKVRDYMRK